VIKIKILNIGRYAPGLALLRENVRILATWCLWILKLLLSRLLLKMGCNDDFYTSCTCNNFNKSNN
jgi:hypothetical protein